MAKNSQALVSVAMLKVSLDSEGRDYIDQLNSFIKAALPTAGSPVDVDKLASRIQEEFGLRVPTAVIERGLRRLAKHGVLRRENAIHVVEQTEVGEDFKSRREKAAVDIARVVYDFVKFYSTAFSAEISETDAQTALVAFVSKFSIECLRAYVFRSPLPKLEHDSQQSYAVARFVDDAYNQRPELFRLILVVFKGVMLSNAFTCPDLDSISRNFSGTSFYFDTPLILSMLGLHGLNEARKLEELVKLLTALRGHSAVFAHTLAEVDSVLAWCETAIQKKQARPGRVLQSLLSEGKSHSDVVLIRGAVERRLEELGVHGAPTPEYRKEYQIDETALQGTLASEVGYPREKALYYDINSVRSIYALRVGHAPRRLEDSKAVFVTSNSTFARAAYSFSRKYEVAKEVSPVITDYSLANVAWLKSPMGANDLPKHELLAMCFAALAPSEAFWSKFLHAAESLFTKGAITADELEILRSDGHARQDAMDLTLGADEELKSADIQSVLDRVKKRLVSERDAEISSKQIAIEQYRRELNVISAENSQFAAALQAHSLEKRMQLIRDGKFIVIVAWLIVISGSTFVTFLSPRDGYWFWLLFACSVLVSTGPPIVGHFGLDLTKRFANWYCARRFRSWARRNIPSKMHDLLN